MAESIVGLYKTECVGPDGPLRTVDALELATADWVDWFNTACLRSALDYGTPINAEQEHYRRVNALKQPHAGSPILHGTRAVQLWIAIEKIEGKRVRDREKERGLPANRRKAEGHLVERVTVPAGNPPCNNSHAPPPPGRISQWRQTSMGSTFTTDCRLP